jgi:bifunctional N-acetylglucosamine-1-phosphate-uridyltransferase/glucosamine-1-phosphate-acetyltransferase GlmU-like protein
MFFIATLVVLLFFRDTPLIAIAVLTTMASCKEEETITPSVLVKPICCPEIYYGEILHNDMYEVGDTIRITYNQMPKHEWAYPNPKHTQYVSVVIIKK